MNVDDKPSTISEAAQLVGPQGLNAALSACERSSQWQHAMQLSESSQIPLELGWSW
jgi:hypothetical protein